MIGGFKGLEFFVFLGGGLFGLCFFPCSHAWLACGSCKLFLDSAGRVKKVGAFVNGL